MVALDFQVVDIFDVCAIGEAVAIVIDIVLGGIEIVFIESEFCAEISHRVGVGRLGMLFDEFVAYFGGAFLVADSKIVPFLEFDVSKGDYGAHDDGGEKSFRFHCLMVLRFSGAI